GPKAVRTVKKWLLRRKWESAAASNQVPMGCPGPAGLVLGETEEMIWAEVIRQIEETSRRKAEEMREAEEMGEGDGLGERMNKLMVDCWSKEGTEAERIGELKAFVKDGAVRADVAEILSEEAPNCSPELRELIEEYCATVVESLPRKGTWKEGTTATEALN